MSFRCANLIRQQKIIESLVFIELGERFLRTEDLIASESLARNYDFTGVSITRRIVGSRPKLKLVHFGDGALAPYFEGLKSLLRMFPEVIKSAVLP